VHTHVADAWPFMVEQFTLTPDRRFAIYNANAGPIRAISIAVIFSRCRSMRDANAADERKQALNGAPCHRG